jgi:anti-sigma factor RsiW
LLDNMELAAEAKHVVSQFEFTDAALNNHVQEFLRQMGVLRAAVSSILCEHIGRITN